MLTIAYIGFGRSVRRFHLPYVEKRKEIVKVKYIYRRKEDVEREGKEAEEWYPNIIFTNNLDEIMKDPEVNLVVINTPNSSHITYSKIALENGKNILCEKPFSTTSKEAKEIFDYAKGKGLIAMSNQNRRFDADLRTVKKVLDSGVLGQLVEIESHYDYYRPEYVKDINYFKFLLGLAVHPLDQIVYLFGLPKKVNCDVRSIANPGCSDDYFDYDLYYDGFKATVKTSFYVKLSYPRFILHGTKGSFIMPSLGHKSSKKVKDGPEKIVTEPSSEETWGTLSYINNEGEDITMKVPTEIEDYGMIYDHLNEVIEGKIEKNIKDEEVIAVLEMIEQGIKAAKEVK